MPHLGVSLWKLYLALNRQNLNHVEKYFRLPFLLVPESVWKCSASSLILYRSSINTQSLVYTREQCKTFWKTLAHNNNLWTTFVKLSSTAITCCQQIQKPWNSPIPTLLVYKLLNLQPNWTHFCDVLQIVIVFFLKILYNVLKHILEFWVAETEWWRREQRSWLILMTFLTSQLKQSTWNIISLNFVCSMTLNQASLWGSRKQEGHFICLYKSWAFIKTLKFE